MPDENVEPKGPKDREEPSPLPTGAGQHGHPTPGPQYAPPPHGGYPGAPGAGAGYPGAPGAPGGYPGQFPRRVTRRMDDRLIAGVASGLGAYFNIDPVVFRVGFVALTLAGGVGVLIYLLCWVLLPPAFGPNGPPQGQAVMPAALRQGGWKTHLAIGAVLLALVLLFSPFTRPTVVFALLLIALGVMLMVQDQPGGGRSPEQPGPGGAVPPGAVPAPGGGVQPGQSAGQGQGGPTATAGGAPAATAPAGTAPAASPRPSAGQGPPGAGGQPGAQDPYGTWTSTPAWGQPGGWGQPAGAASSATAPTGWGSSPTAVMEPARRRPRPIVGYVTMALALLAAGVAGALDNFGVVHMTPARTLALMLTVIGVGALVGSLWGRAGWLIVVGCLLLPAVAVSSVLKDVSVGGRAGDLVEQPLTLDEVQSEYRLGAGDFTIDLSAVAFGPRPRTVNGRLSAGDMTVIVPREQLVVVHARVGAGDIQALGREQSGLQVRSDVTDPPSGRGAPLTLDLGVGVGSITVRRGP